MTRRLQRSIERRTNKAGESDSSHIRLGFIFVNVVHVTWPDFHHFDALVSIQVRNAQIVIYIRASASQIDRTIA